MCGKFAFSAHISHCELNQCDSSLLGVMVLQHYNCALQFQLKVWIFIEILLVFWYIDYKWTCVGIGLWGNPAYQDSPHPHPMIWWNFFGLILAWLCGSWVKLLSWPCSLDKIWMVTTVRMILVMFHWSQVPAQVLSLTTDHPHDHVSSSQFAIILILHTYAGCVICILLFIMSGQRKSFFFKSYWRQFITVLLLLKSCLSL